MVERTPSWLLKVLRLYIQYFCASLASIPAGLLAYALIKSGLSEFASLGVAIIPGLAIAIIVWQILDRRLPVGHRDSVQSQTALIALAWDFEHIRGSAYIAGTIVLATTVTTFSSRSSVECKSLSECSRTGTATRMQVPSNKE
jgi:hypothetical protein